MKLTKLLYPLLYLLMMTPLKASTEADQAKREALAQDVVSGILWCHKEVGYFADTYDEEGCCSDTCEKQAWWQKGPSHSTKLEKFMPLGDGRYPRVGRYLTTTKLDNGYTVEMEITYSGEDIFVIVHAN